MEVTEQELLNRMLQTCCSGNPGRVWMLPELYDCIGIQSHQELLLGNKTQECRKL